MDAREYLDRLLQLADQRGMRARLADWRKVIRWRVGVEEFFWSSRGGAIEWSDPAAPDITLSTGVETLHKIVSEGFPFFMAIWGSGEIQFDCSFGDVYRLGYAFLRDKRRRRVIFVSHCWLNINARFPEGAAFEGANTALMQLLLQEGLGIIQMPCPEQVCLGLEKYAYGAVVGEQLRGCFRRCAESVVEQLKEYLVHGYEVVGIMGMNPSPSCGVEVTKGRGTMEGTDRNTAEQPGPGLFSEELVALLRQEGIDHVPLFGIRRLLCGEAGLEQRVRELHEHLKCGHAVGLLPTEG